MRLSEIQRMQQLAGIKLEEDDKESNSVIDYAAREETMSAVFDKTFEQQSRRISSNKPLTRKELLHIAGKDKKQVRQTIKSYKIPYPGYLKDGDTLYITGVTSIYTAGGDESAETIYNVGYGSNDKINYGTDDSHGDYTRNYSEAKRWFNDEFVSIINKHVTVEVDYGGDYEGYAAVHANDEPPIY